MHRHTHTTCNIYIRLAPNGGDGGGSGSTHLCGSDSLYYINNKLLWKFIIFWLVASCRLKTAREWKTTKTKTTVACLRRWRKKKTMRKLKIVRVRGWAIGVRVREIERVIEWCGNFLFNVQLFPSFCQATKRQMSESIN